MTTTHTEDQIHQRHRDRVAELLANHGDIFKVPQDKIMWLHEQNRLDWTQHIEERDGRARRARAAEDAPPTKSPTPEKKPAVSDTNAAQVAEVQEAIDAFMPFSKGGE